MLVYSSPALAMPKNREAASKLEEGLSLYRNEDYAGAAEAFEQGYAIEPDATFLYTWAQAERLRGNCTEAVNLYTRFIETSPPEVQIAAAQDGKARCADTLAQETATRAQVEEDELDELADSIAEPAPTTPAPAASSTPSRDEAEPPEPWQRDPAAGALVGVGAVGLGAGVGLLIGAAVIRPATYAEAQTYKRRSRSLSVAGGVTLGVGAVLLLAGAIRYGVLARRQRSTEMVVAPSFDGQTGSVVWSGRF